MNKVEIRLNYQEIGNLLKSDEVVAELNTQADAIMGKLSGAYEKTEYIGARRANVSVATADNDTYYRNLHNNELLKAVGGRG